MSQYDMSIVYIAGEDNTVADSLSCVHPNTFPDEFAEEDEAQMFWFKPLANAMLSITIDASILETIKSGYKSDSFCLKVMSAGTGMKAICESNGLWYIGDCLLIS